MRAGSRHWTSRSRCDRARSAPHSPGDKRTLCLTAFLTHYGARKPQSAYLAAKRAPTLPMDHLANLEILIADEHLTSTLRYG
jgi:hypothetical protein